MQNTALTDWNGGSRIQASADIVIVGNGIAGLTAAVEARRWAPDATILVLTEQCHPTINTPALKQVIAGKIERRQLLAYPEGTESAWGIKVVMARVEAIDAYERLVALARGGYVRYGRLLLATGSVARGLPADLPGVRLDGVLTLHRLSDYLDLRRRLREVREVVVIGGGVHGAETVMSLVQLGKRVHWLVRSSHCLPNLLPRGAAEPVLRHMQRAGVEVHLESEVIAILGTVGEVAAVATADGRVIPCQLVLVCTGMRPAVELAARCHPQLVHEAGRGILVDEYLCTSVPSILAAGDVAACRDPLTGRYRTQSCWHAAVVQGRMAAAVMTGQETAPLDEVLGVPWHATRLGTLSILAVGHPLAETQDVTVLTEQGKNSYRRIAVAHDRLVGYLAIGSVQPDALAIKRLIDEGWPIAPIKDALLKGAFDARTYFTQLRSSSLYPSTVSRQAAALAPQPLTPPVRVPALAASLPCTPAPFEGGEPFLQGSATRRRPQTEPLRRLIPAQRYAASRSEVGSSPLSDPDRPRGDSPLRRLSLPASDRPRSWRYLRSVEIAGSFSVGNE
jgi:NAD(P)H-nitrite reductase large subunit